MKKLEKLKLKDITDFDRIPEKEQMMLKGGVNYDDYDFVQALIGWMGTRDIHSFTISNGSYEPVVVYQGSIVEYNAGPESAQEVIYISEENNSSIEFTYNDSEYTGLVTRSGPYYNTYKISENS